MSLSPGLRRLSRLTTFCFGRCTVGDTDSDTILAYRPSYGIVSDLIANGKGKVYAIENSLGKLMMCW